MGTKLKLPENWCAKLKMEESVSEEISNQILDLYENTKVKEKNKFTHISPENNTWGFRIDKYASMRRHPYL